MRPLHSNQTLEGGSGSACCSGTVPTGGQRALTLLFWNELVFPLTSLQGLEVSVKTVIKYGVTHAKYKGICMKAYCSLGTACTAFTFKANLMAQIFCWGGCLGLGHWLMSSDSLISSLLWCEHLWIWGKSCKVWLHNRILLTNSQIFKHGSEP